MSEYVNEPENSNILQEFEVLQYETATRTHRFFNFLLDGIFMRFVITYGTSYLIGIILAETSPELLYDLTLDNYWGLLLLSYIVYIINNVLYYTICEKAFKGYTIGKLLTRTRAIRQDGKELTFKDALLRSLVRLVPFEPFSGFGTLWHDQWTNTTVVKKN